ncbi:MAG: hypothetical protein DMF60_01920 [Acidobacteria bacterium]|nr:MAG: hypothetical protein DMF60_01920 [Acidobacteriota bacterium]
MQDAEELYSKTVSRLSPNERLRLASLILDGLAQEKKKAGRSVLDVLDVLPAGGRLLKTSAEADAYLREERDSWDR